MGLEKVYTESKYLKAGMIATDLIHENEIQADFFEPFESSKKNSVPSVIDRGECQVWQEVIRMVVEGYEKGSMQQEYLSHCYTTKKVE